MHLFKNTDGIIYAYSDEDLINLAKQKYPYSEVADEKSGEITKFDDFTTEELLTKGHEIVIDDYGYAPFSYTDEEIGAQEQERLKQQQIAEAHSLLSRSIKLESGVYQRIMSAEQQAEFVLWQDLLLEFIKNERQDLPPTPEFINQLLEEL